MVVHVEKSLCVKEYMGLGVSITCCELSLGGDWKILSE